MNLKIKQVFVLTVLIWMLICGIGYAENQTGVIINNQKQSYSQSPVNQNGTILVPLRGIFEALGASIDFNAKTQEITAKKEDKEVWLKVGSNSTKINGTTTQISTPAQLINGHTMVPLRFVGEAFDADVKWDPKLNSAIILTKDFQNGKTNELTPTNKLNNSKLFSKLSINEPLIDIIFDNTKKEYIAITSSLKAYKIDSEGKLIWSYKPANLHIDDSEDESNILQLKDKNYLVVGKTYPANKKGDSIITIKLDQNGKELWSKNFLRGTNKTLIRDAISTDDGFLLLSSIYENKNWYEWLVKVNHNGEIVWEQVYGGYRTPWKRFENLLTLETTMLHDIDATSDGGFILSGWISEEDGKYAFWILKVDSKGEKVWEKSIPNNNPYSAKEISENPDGNYILLGQEKNEYRLLELDKNGNTLIDRKYPKKGTDYSRLKEMDQIGDLYYYVTFENGNSEDIFYLTTLDKNYNITKENTFTIPRSALDFRQHSYPTGYMLQVKDSEKFSLNVHNEKTNSLDLLLFDATELKPSGSYSISNFFKK